MMNELTPDDYLLVNGMPPAGADWAAYQSQFARAELDCPPLADVADAALGVAEPALELRVRQHLPGCSHCRSLYETTRKLSFGMSAATLSAPTISGRTISEPAGGPSSRELPARPARVTRPESSQDSSVVLTGVFTLLLTGRVQEALQLVQPYLPEVLQAVGLQQADPGDLWDFIQHRLRREPHPNSSLPDWLEEFAVERLGLPGLPRPAGRGAAQWEAVLTRCALRTIETSLEETEPIRQFARDALESGEVETPSDLDMFRLRRGESAGVNEEDSTRLVRLLSDRRQKVSRLFGLN